MTWEFSARGVPPFFHIIHRRDFAYTYYSYTCLTRGREYTAPVPRTSTNLTLSRRRVRTKSTEVILFLFAGARVCDVRVCALN